MSNPVVIYANEIRGSKTPGGVAIPVYFPDGITAVTILAAGTSGAQGGAVGLTGGTSTTSGNAGGAVTNVGGTPGATGVGGAVTNTGAAGGATSGTGGAVTNTGGAGTAGNAAGGAVVNRGGAGQGSAAGGASSVIGGAGGATGIGGAAALTGGAGGATSGKGGTVTLTGGAGTNGNASGGSIVATPGAKNGSGLDGGIFARHTANRFYASAAAVTKTDTNASMTAAEMLNGIIQHTVTTGRSLTTPTGAALTAACPTDLAAGDTFDFSVQAIGIGADDISTLTAGDGDITFTGSVVVGGADPAGGAGACGLFSARYTGTTAWVIRRKG